MTLTEERLIDEIREQTKVLKALVFTLQLKHQDILKNLEEIRGELSCLKQQLCESLERK